MPRIINDTPAPTMPWKGVSMLDVPVRPICGTITGTYIVAGEGTGLIKIGISRSNIIQRLDALQAASPAILRLLMVIPDVTLEKILHEHFAECRRHGEWFLERPVRLWVNRTRRRYHQGAPADIVPTPEPTSWFMACVDRELAQTRINILQIRPSW